MDPTRGVNAEMLAYEQALRDAMAAGREKERELATTSLEFEFQLQLPIGSASDSRQSAWSGNERTSANVNKQ